MTRKECRALYLISCRTSEDFRNRVSFDAYMDALIDVESPRDIDYDKEFSPEERKDLEKYEQNFIKEE